MVGMFDIVSATLLIIFRLAKIGTSVDTLHLSMAYNVNNIVTDIILIALPLPKILKLKLPLRQRFTLYGILLIASGALTASVLRLARVVMIQSILDDPDQSWIQSTSFLMSVIEMNLGIICNSVVLLRPFAARYLPWLIGIHAVKEKRENKNNEGNGRRLGTHNWWSRQNNSALHPEISSIPLDGLITPQSMSETMADTGVDGNMATELERGQRAKSNPYVNVKYGQPVL
ncbi:hypothetical protein BGZ63DRAFT_468521 [Mariannaea sp. PMI_226]|nr:hypothetical protein BGZ63DRAFT_438964 [Mariannaea sp. PMI_226]KAI5455803.1 hypothetical protein BGZ63DRAFT_468521 [Mariannaea sp. PMI_226]